MTKYFCTHFSVFTPGFIVCSAYTGALAEMPPRRRSRKRRLLRIDAAIDAMLPLGFTERKVRQCVKELLKEYGGDEGWPFIEDSSYTELVTAILRDVEREKQEQIAEDGDEIMLDQDQDQDQLKDKSDSEEEPSLTHSRASDNLQHERSLTNTVVDGEPISCESLRSKSDGKGWKDILPDQTSALAEETAVLVSKKHEDPPCKIISPIIITEFPAIIPPLPPPTKSGRRFPSYGWIESDEEDGDDFITLKPSSMVLGPPEEAQPR